MRVQEFTGKTTQDAIDQGLAQLGVTIADVHVDVLQEGAKGLFGLFGSKPARVRLTVLEEEKEEAPMGIHWSLDEEKPKKKKPEAKPQEQRREAPRPPKQPKPKTEPKPERAEVKPEAPKAQEPQEQTAPAKEERSARPRPERAPKAERAPRAPREPRPARPPKPKADVKREPMAPATVFEPTEPPVIYPEDTPAGRAQRFLMEVTEKMGVQASIYVDESREDALSLRIIGDTLGILIGRRGETLDALQYLTSLQVNKGKDEYIRVTLDTENYRARREDSLRRLALRMANRAQKTGRRVVMEPMNPYERRVMHTALQNHPAVDTHSEGEEPNRRVVITLKSAEPAFDEEAAETAGKRPAPAKRKRKRSRPRKPKTAQQEPLTEALEEAAEAVDAAETVEAVAEAVETVEAAEIVEAIAETASEAAAEAAIEASEEI